MVTATAFHFMLSKCATGLKASVIISQNTQLDRFCTSTVIYYTDEATTLIIDILIGYFISSLQHNSIGLSAFQSMAALFRIAPISLTSYSISPPLAILYHERHTSVCMSSSQSAFAIFSFILKSITDFAVLLPLNGFSAAGTGASDSSLQ